EIRALPPDERQQFAHSLSEDDVEEPSAIDELEEVAEGVHDSCPDDAVEEVPPDPPVSARTPASAPPAARPTAGYKFTDDLQITDVSPGGPASRAGLKVGDVVTGVAATPVRNKKQYSVAIKKIRPDQPVTISFKRGPRSRTTTMSF
ncbi:hypothetical protein DIPPA_00841, partial [Diplonema papillatum]